MGGGRDDKHFPTADLLDSPLEDDEETDDETLLQIYLSLGPDPQQKRTFPIPSDTGKLSGAELLKAVRKDPGLLPDVYLRLKPAFLVGDRPLPLAMLLREIADAIAPRRRRGQPSWLSSNAVRRNYLNRVYAYREVREQYRRTNKLPPAELLPVIESDGEVLTIDDPRWPAAAARQYSATFFSVSPHTIDSHVKRLKGRSARALHEEWEADFCKAPEGK